MSKEKKYKLVAELQSLYQDHSIVVTHYHGLDNRLLTSLRTKLRSNGANFKIVKNTLAKLAINKESKEIVNDLFTGPSAIAYSKDPVLAAKLVVDFANTNKKLKIVGGVIGNEVLGTEGIEAVAKLPSLDELRCQILGLIQSPATKLANVIQGPASQIARVLSAHTNKNN